ncbi:MAG: hypothetical protein Ct9H90mP27_4440 [Gammaproteobacteria bacterium]|nr:MAG: hypothetical protein Ct9H90mP27_4440 [Gammaproteobacteria bacterium]
MSIFEYMSMVVAIVLGISITNLLNKLAITLRVGSWGTLWFRSLWCVILLICTIGYLWAFWRIYVDYTEISIWSFIFGPFFTVVCFFLISVLLPIPRDLGQTQMHLMFFWSKRNLFTCFGGVGAHLDMTVVMLDFEQLPLEKLFGYLMVPISLLGCWLKT